jgi:hypothetical protein
MKIQKMILVLALFLGITGCHAHASSSGSAADVHVATVDDDACVGALSCTADFVGDVVTFPFRLIASIF